MLVLRSIEMYQNFKTHPRGASTLCRAPKGYSSVKRETRLGEGGTRAHFNIDYKNFGINVN